jgi:hypothetical protein
MAHFYPRIKYLIIPHRTVGSLFHWKTNVNNSLLQHKGDELSSDDSSRVDPSLPHDKKLGIVCTILCSLVEFKLWNSQS